MKKRIASSVLLFVISTTSCGSNGPKNLLVIGNSITKHGPKPASGWHGDWGMAAPSEADDFSHRTAAALQLPLTTMGAPVERNVDLAQIPPIATDLSPGTIVILEFGVTCPPESSPEEM